MSATNIRYVLRPESLTILKNDFLLHIQLPTFSSPSFIRAIYARVPLVVIVCFTRFTKVITNKTRNQIVWKHSFHLIQTQKLCYHHGKYHSNPISFIKCNVSTRSSDFTQLRKGEKLIIRKYFFLFLHRVLLTLRAGGRTV